MEHRPFIHPRVSRRTALQVAALACWDSERIMWPRCVRPLPRRPFRLRIGR